MGQIGKFERAMERWTARVWEAVRGPRPPRLEVVDVLRKECDDKAMILGHARAMVPNHFTIELPPESHALLAPHQDTLGLQLATLIRRYAAERRYVFAGPVVVRLARHPEAPRYRVRSAVRAAVRVPAAGRDDRTQLLPLPTEPPCPPPAAGPPPPPRPPGTRRPPHPPFPPIPAVPSESPVGLTPDGAPRADIGPGLPSRETETRQW
ncbi:DUF3662 domain-containing protein [Streptomyces cacaoi]